ncbi:DUF4349 domain-containing protein [Heyndrickxia sporothermodurans]
MKRFWKMIVLLSLTMTLLIACSNNDHSSKSGEKQDIASSSDKMKADHSTENQTEDEKSNNEKMKAQSRMVVYNAGLNMEVKKLTEVQGKITQIVKQMGGYIVQQNQYQTDNERLESSLTARIPQEHFHSFLDQVKKLGIKTKDQNISGEDVTEEYVDLNSRLKSKKLVEKRLTKFMNEAKDTKTLLAISTELGKVQEEIETIEGRIKYLENQTSLSTVTITLTEDKVVVPGLEGDKQTTWEKTKKQFMQSINFIVSFFSGLFIFIIGYFPVLVILGLIGVVIAIVWRRIKKKSENTIGK